MIPSRPYFFMIRLRSFSAAALSRFAVTPSQAEFPGPGQSRDTSSSTRLTGRVSVPKPRGFPPHVRRRFVLAEADEKGVAKQSREAVDRRLPL